MFQNNIIMNEFSENDKKFMKLALEEAKISSLSGNFPCGCCFINRR